MVTLTLTPLLLGHQHCSQTSFNDIHHTRLSTLPTAHIRPGQDAEGSQQWGWWPGGVRPHTILLCQYEDDTMAKSRALVQSTRCDHNPYLQTDPCSATPNISPNTLATIGPHLQHSEDQVCSHVTSYPAQSQMVKSTTAPLRPPKIQSRHLQAHILPQPKGADVPVCSHPRRRDQFHFHATFSSGTINRREAGGGGGGGGGLFVCLFFLTGI